MMAREEEVAEPLVLETVEDGCKHQSRLWTEVGCALVRPLPMV